MGPKNSHGVNKQDRVSRNHFDFLYVIGKGGFGKVWKVSLKKYKKLFALKEMSKLKIIDRKSEKSIIYEKELLSKLKHPFIVNMLYTFQDFDNLYLVMDLLTGGDLRYHISRQKKFTEDQTKFFIACMLLGLEYIHTNKVLHRDIKPENLVLDDKGYIRITDFGVAKVYQKENSSETSGTPGYMAPEVMCGQNHSHMVDYFAIGVLGFEFMFGFRPYLGKTRKEIKELIIAKQVQIKRHDVPENWSIEAADFVNKMLQRKPVNRLGFNGFSEIKDHLWFKNFPWQDLYNKKLLSPYIPKNSDNFDKRYCESSDKIGNETYERYQLYYKNPSFGDIFRNYTHANIIIRDTETPGTKTPVRSGNNSKSTTIRNSSGTYNSKTKQKISDTILKVKGSNNGVSVSSSTNSISNVLNTPTRIRSKNNSMTGIALNQYKSAKINKISSVTNIGSPVMKKNDKVIVDRLPFIESKLMKNSTTKARLLNTGSSSQKLTNSTTSSNSILKNSNKFSTISSNSTGSSSGNSQMHKRYVSSNVLPY